FDHEPTALEMSAVDRANTRLQSSAGAFQRLDGLKAFTDALENASDNFIVIVGHNDRGRFRFPDGTYKELPVLAQMAVQAHKRVIFISCNTKGVLPGVPGTAGLLTYDEALHVADHLRGAIGQRQRAGRSLSLSDVTQFIQGDLDQAQGQYKSRGHVYYIVCTAGAVGGILVLNSLERADSSSARAP